MAQPPEKSEGAFRTIREVADWLAIPTHVLRFWESKFPEITPVKGAGGRRYYRPEDMRLLGGIKVMVHDQGVTIRGVSKKITDEGVEPVMALSPDLDAAEVAPVGTRRVIRSGEDEADDPRVVPFEAQPEPAPEVGTRMEEDDADGGDAQPDADPMPEQPDADPMPEQPVDTDAPPQPEDDLLPDIPAPPQPVDNHVPATPDPAPDDDASAPTEPVRPGPGVPDDAESDMPAPTEDEPGQLGDAPVDDDEEADAPPVDRPASATRLPLGTIDRRRLRRAIRKLRGMIEDVEQELSDRSGP